MEILMIFDHSILEFLVCILFVFKDSAVEANLMPLLPQIMKWIPLVWEKKKILSIPCICHRVVERGAQSSV